LNSLQITNTGALNTGDGAGTGVFYSFRYRVAQTDRQALQRTVNASEGKEAKRTGERPERKKKKKKKREC